MTEQDWLNSCFTPNGDNLSDEDLIFAMHIWADWVEENGLGYERGLRMMADYKHGPRLIHSYGPPFSLTEGITSRLYPCLFSTNDWSFRNTVPEELIGLFIDKNKTLRFTDALTAVKALAFAMQDHYKE